MIRSYVLAFISSFSWQRLKNAAFSIVSLCLSIFLHRPVVWGKPFVLTIEPTNLCDLHCPQCDTGSNRSKRPRGYLQMDTFKKILLDCKDHLMYLIFFDQGEPLLHPHYFEMVRLAKSYRLYVVCSTNGQRLAEKNVAMELVQSGLDELIISVDGLSETTYRYYRRGGSLRRVLAGMEMLKNLRTSLKRTNPRIIIQFIVMRHNEAERPFVRATARRWGADDVYLKSAYIATIQDAEEYLPKNEKFRRYEIKNGVLQRKNPSRICKRCWYSAVVHWNGAIVPCCFDREETFVLGKSPQPIGVIWQGIAYQQFRNAFFNQRPDICRNCTDGIKIYFS